MVNLTDRQIVDDLVGSLKHSGYNVDRSNLSMVLNLVLSDLRGLKKAAELSRRYLKDPFQIEIDKNCQYQAAVDAVRRERQEKESAES